MNKFCRTVASLICFLVTAVGMNAQQAAPGAATYFHQTTPTLNSVGLSFPVYVAPGYSFFTTLKVATTQTAVGAFSVILIYDTKALQIQQIVPAAGSPFGTNVFADTSSFFSGSTRIVGFQTTNSAPLAQGDPICDIVWRTVGNMNQDLAITNIVETHVDTEWLTDSVGSVPEFVYISSGDPTNDGIPDWWMEEYFGHPTGMTLDNSLPNDDADGTGMSNLQKYQAGLNPLDPNSRLQVTSMQLLGTNVMIGFSSVLARNYQVESSQDLDRNSWEPVGGVVAGSGGKLYVMDTGGALVPLRFYRVQVSP